MKKTRKVTHKLTPEQIAQEEDRKECDRIEMVKIKQEAAQICLSAPLLIGEEDTISGSVAGEVLERGLERRYEAVCCWLLEIAHPLPVEYGYRMTREKILRYIGNDGVYGSDRMRAVFWWLMFVPSVRKVDDLASLSVPELVRHRILSVDALRFWMSDNSYERQKEAAAQEKISKWYADMRKIAKGEGDG